MIDSPLIVVIGIVLLGVGLWFVFGRKEDVEEKQEPVFQQSVDVDGDEDPFVVEPVANRQTSTSQRRKLKAKRHRPAKNHRHYSRHGYNDGVGMEDILFWLWLLDDEDFIWGEAAEYDIEGVDGLSYIAYDGQGIQFFDEDGVESILVHSIDDESYHVEGSDGLNYDVTPTEDSITLLEDGVSKTFVLTDNGDWVETKTEQSNGSEVSDTVEDFVEDSGIGLEEVAVAAATVAVASEVVEAVEEVIVDSGSDDTSTDSSVDSDTSY